MTLQHQPVVFECEGSDLVGIIEHPPEPQDTGVLIVTGGPQYRAGSHRQFVSIARQLATAGYTTMRFDYRGTGDSDCPEVSFDETATDLKAAIDTFFVNTNLKQVVLWGLCDAASAALIYAHNDNRVIGLVLLNPWVRTEEGLAQAYIKNYYLQRLFSQQLWSKLVSGGFEWRTAFRELVRNTISAVRVLLRFVARSEKIEDDRSNQDFRERMRSGLENTDAEILFLLCGNDLTAMEFADYAKQSRAWRASMAGSSVTQLHLPGMDHTFSTSTWRSQIIDATLEWISHLPGTVTH